MGVEINLNGTLVERVTVQLLRRADDTELTFQFKHTQTILHQGMNNG